MADSVADFFSELQGKIDPEKVAGMNAIYQFVLSGDGGGEWYVAFQDGAAAVHEGSHNDPSITLTVAASDWLDIINGKLSGQSAFLTGKLKIQGDMSLALKLQNLFLG